VDDVGGRDETARTPRTASTSLPRRSRQHHLEPQLREPGGAGNGTPFAAFADADLAPDGAGEAAAAFRRGTDRGRSES
jgi:hypothetical protein